MKLNVKALVLAGGIIWALALFLTGIVNIIWAGYGTAFLEVMASVYPGYSASGSIGDLIVGVIYAFIDGALCGFVFGLLYNAFVGKQGAPQKTAAKKVTSKRGAGRRRTKR